jgi:fatty acid elongase 3
MSAVLWFAMLCELGLIGRSYGVWSLTCDPLGHHISGPIYFIYYINYIFKYIELIDTFLLALRGKPIPFLHIYHHAATLILCWSQLWAQSCIQWLPIAINLMVHIIMYAYYTLHALGCDIWWKKYLTMLQIVQFVAALTGCILAFGARILSNGLHLIDESVFGCHGTYEGAYVGIAVIASYLYLFLVMYNHTYSKKQKASVVKPISNDRALNGNGKHVAEDTLRESNGNGNGYHRD